MTTQIPTPLTITKDVVTLLGVIGSALEATLPAHLTWEHTVIAVVSAVVAFGAQYLKAGIVKSALTSVEGVLPSAKITVTQAPVNPSGTPLPS